MKAKVEIFCLVIIFVFIKLLTKTKAKVQISVFVKCPFVHTTFRCLRIYWYQSKTYNGL